MSITHSSTCTIRFIHVEQSTPMSSVMQAHEVMFFRYISLSSVRWLQCVFLQ